MAVTQNELITALQTLLSTTDVRLLMRTGTAAQLDLSSLVAGEFAVATDTQEVYACFGDGIFRNLARGIVVKGVYANLSALQSAHPTGTDGDIYAAGSVPQHLYVWTASTWTDMGAWNDTTLFATNSAVVHKTGDETVDGVKTFTSSPIVPTPTTATQASNKAYADTKVSLTGNETVAGIKTFSSQPIIPNGTTSTAAVNKGQLDLKMNLAGGSSNPFTGMPYLGTVPIVESGSNANGYFVKFADGTMICTKSVTFTNAAVTNVTGALFYSVGKSLGSWAATFNSAPMSVVDAVRSPELILQTTTVAATTTNAPTIVLLGATSATVTVVANVIGVGRWKA